MVIPINDWWYNIILEKKIATQDGEILVLWNGQKVKRERTEAFYRPTYKLFEIKCPVCDLWYDDYKEVWSECDNISAGKHIAFKCQKCSADLKIWWDNEKVSYFLERNCQWKKQS